MDASQSPTPSEEGSSEGRYKTETGGDNAPEPLEHRNNGTSFFKNLFWRGAAEPDPDAPLSERDLGPRFATTGAAERAMILNILRLNDLRVEDVMTPRADVLAVSDETGLEEVMETFERGGLSRLPVYHETLDDPLGFVHLKDLALRYGVGRACDPTSFSLAAHLHTALYVPPSMRIGALLQKMQAGRVHMALVIDEFGGVDGLVTIEDLVEQVVGDIEDEHDTQELLQWRAEAPGVYLSDARADIREFEEAENVTLLPVDWEEEVDTLGGLVFMLCGRVPARGEVVTHPAGHEFEIIDADPRRIRRLRLTLEGAIAGRAEAPLRAAAE